MRISRPARTSLALICWLTGCQGGGPSLDELNETKPTLDPRVDDTPPDAPFEGGQARDAGDADAVFTVTTANEWFRGVLVPGDLDGDGFDDLVVWGLAMSDPDVVPCDDGCPAFERLRAHVVYGAADFGGDLAPDAIFESWHLPGMRPSVAAAGDVNGDGRPDLALGITPWTCDPGSAFVVRGGGRLSGTHDVRDVGAMLRAEETCNGFGGAEGIGDLDGDGLAELAVRAAYGDPSRVFVYYGQRGEAPARRAEVDADFVLVGAEGRVTTARRAGDVNGDGFGDLLVDEGPQDDDASPERNHTWSLVLGGGDRLGGESSVTDVATGRFDARDVVALGDVDADGVSDLALLPVDGERDAAILRGRAEWPSDVSAADADAWIEGLAATRGSSGPFAATTVASVGDVDGDGAPDVLFGDANGGRAGAVGGAAFLFRGPFAGQLDATAATEFLGRDWFSALEPDVHRGADTLGGVVTQGTGDLNGDGLDDLVLVAAAPPDGGRIYVWLGRR